jgi:hypothetical protein
LERYLIHGSGAARPAGDPHPPGGPHSALPSVKCNEPGRPRTKPSTSPTSGTIDTSPRIEIELDPVQQSLVSPRVGHLHVTVDNVPWHFVDTSGETVILVGLDPGPHMVLFELADAAHRILTSETVRFTLPAVVAAKAH